MSLADVQRAVAELICDGASLDAYRREPAAWLAARAMSERERRVLDGVDVDSLAAFHEIHARDRAFFVAAVLPVTTTRLGDRWSERYFAAFPYGADDTRVEARRFAAYVRAREDAGSAALGQVELDSFLLLDQRPFRASRGPSDPAFARLAAGIAVVPVAVDVPALFEDPHAHPAARPGAVLLRRDEEGVTTAWLEGAHAEVLAAIARRDAGALRSLVASPAGHEAFRDLSAEGVLQ